MESTQDKQAQVDEKQPVIIYDSFFGNTEQIALAIKDGMGKDVRMFNIKKGLKEIQDLKHISVLIIGSPTRGFLPSPDIQAFIKDMECSVEYFAAFDTRIDLATIQKKFLRYVVDKGGYAAKVISRRMKKKGAKELVPSAGFIVGGEEGPLQEGELEKARLWGQQICKGVLHTPTM